MKSSQRLASIAQFTNVNRYLEIGVSLGTTFNELDFPNKVAVDPRFGFDYRSLASDSVRFFETPSDVYFTDHAGNELFDLIFLDGLHTHDQTLRDFNNALMHSHPATIVLIDDVYPSDVFSSLRKDGVQQRRLFDPNSTSKAWHGDVYKTMFIIHDFYPLVSFVTIDRGFGNPQSIVYRQPRRDFSPRFKSIEAIERLSYFDFLEHRELLNLRSEGDALGVVAGFLAGVTQ